MADDVAYTSATTWAPAEVDAVLAVRKRLVEEKALAPHELGEIELITVTLNSKCRVQEAVDKFVTYYEQLVGLYNIADVWADAKVDGMDTQWHRLAVAGRDEGDRQIMWIQGSPEGTPVAEETPCIRAGCHYFFAVHADRTTLRNGISLVINTAGRSSKVGNEKKLQVAWQNYPTRPQHIYICGTTMVMRVVINALIAFASLFAKNKVLARIKFAQIRDIERTCGKAALPETLGGDARAPTEEWVRERIAGFPRMDLPEYA